MHDFSFHEINDLYKQVSNNEQSDDNNSNEYELKKINIDIKSEKKSSLNNKLICFNCKSANIYYDKGSTFCKECGYKLEQIIDNEYINCSEKNIYARFGIPVNNFLPQSSLGTTISNNNFYEFYKLKKYHQWTQMPYKERSLYKAFQNLTLLATRGFINNSIIEQSKSYYQQFCELKITRGINRSSIMAACVYFACKENSVPRTCKEISEMFDLNICDMTKGCKLFNQVLNKCNRNMNDINPLHYIRRFCNKLKISTDIQFIIEYSAIKAIILNIVNENTPGSISSGSIWFVINIYNLDKEITKKEISKICKISEVTISKCYKKMKLVKHELLPIGFQNNKSFQ